jgi:hypothetical protein
MIWLLDWIKTNPKKALGIIVAIGGALYGTGETVFRTGEWKAEVDEGVELASENQTDIRGLIEYQIKLIERDKSEAEAEKRQLEYIAVKCAAGTLTDVEDCARARVAQ